MNHAKLCCLLLCCGPLATPALQAHEKQADEKQAPQGAAAPQAVPVVPRRVGGPLKLDLNVAAKMVLAAKLEANKRDKVAKQLRPAMNRELAFIRRAAELTDEQRRKISIDAEAALLELAAENDNVVNGRVILRVNGAFMQPATEHRKDMQSMIRQRARQSADPHLTVAQRANLETELQHRADAEKIAMIENLLLQIDAQVRLSRSQYEEMKKSFLDKWQHSVSLRFNAGQVFTVPAVPDELVLPFLNDVQKTAWELANKAPSYTSFNQTNNTFDETLWEAPAGEFDATVPNAEANGEEVQHAVP